MVDFKPVHARRNNHDGCIYNRLFKHRKRQNYPTHTIHIKPLPREKCAIIKLTRLGYSINTLQTYLGRSASYIHRAIRNAITQKLDHLVDKRKLPSATRLTNSKIRHATLAKYWNGWEAFIYAEVDKPP